MLNIPPKSLNYPTMELNIPPKRLNHSTQRGRRREEEEEAQLSKDASKFSSYEAYVLPNYGVSAGKRVVYEVSASVSIGYHASSNHVGIPQKFVVSFDLKAE